MLQDRPYAPRKTERCLCHCGCTDFYHTGALLRVFSSDATDGWLGLRDGTIIPEDERPGVGCGWVGPGQVGPLPLVVWNAEAGLAVVLPSGVPGEWAVVVGGIATSAEFGLEPFLALGTTGFDTQFDCRDIFDVTPAVIQQASGRFPNGYPGTTWHCQWVARHDTWTPPI